MKNKNYIGYAFIKTVNGHFDCVGRITNKIRSPNHIARMGIMVEVGKYLRQQYSKKQQFYYYSEIVEIVPIKNAKAASVLYGA